jgi:hypothetical protein
MIQIKEFLLLLFLFISVVSPDAEKEAKHIKFPTDRECIMKQLKRKPKIHKREIEKNIKIDKLVEFVRLYNPFDSDEYIKDVAESFVKIFDNESNRYKDTVRFYIALCSVESNFRMVQNNSGSSAFGICQVIYKYHGQYMYKIGFGGNIVEYPQNLLLVVNKPIYSAYINLNKLKRKKKSN